MSEELVTIARFSDPMRAELAKSRLDSAGIECYLTNMQISTMLVRASGLVEIELQVRKSDQDEASAYLNQE